ncbi:unnamed protein product [Closterium sp. NIES-53]
MLGRVTYTGRVLYTDLCPCSTKLTTVTTEVVALRAIVLATKSTSAWWHARLAHIGVDTITSLAKHEVATSLDIKPSTGTNSLCVSCDGGKLARHTFPDKGSDADDALAVMHIDLCGPFRVAAKDDSLYFLLLKDRKTRYVWVRLVAKKSDVLREFKKWLVVAERQTKKSVLMLRSDQGGEFIGKEFIAFVDGKGTLVRTMLLHMDVQHHWWHLALRQAIWVHNCLERSTMPPGTTPYQLLSDKKPDLSLACVWGCMAQFLVPKQWQGEKLQPKARWGLHLGVSEESKGWELLDITDNRVVTTSDVVFYETMSLEVGELAHEDADDVLRPSPPHAPLAPPLLADRHGMTLVSASGGEGSSGASPVALAKSIAGGRHDVKPVGVRERSTPTGEQQVEGVQPTLVKPVKKASTRKSPAGEQPA